MGHGGLFGSAFGGGGPYEQMTDPASEIKAKSQFLGVFDQLTSPAWPNQPSTPAEDEFPKLDPILAKGRKFDL